mmetsp:Transcript_12113/g.24131  ORF Transcript_12113/g.24131 Transcript_12113/m.24131 type:complete len:150 (-) Transcript_12113:100-549(-)
MSSHELLDHRSWASPADSPRVDASLCECFHEQFGRQEVAAVQDELGAIEQLTVSDPVLEDMTARMVSTRIDLSGVCCPESDRPGSCGSTPSPKRRLRIAIMNKEINKETIFSPDYFKARAVFNRKTGRRLHTASQQQFLQRRTPRFEAI